MKVYKCSLLLKDSITNKKFLFIIKVFKLKKSALKGFFMKRNFHEKEFFFQ